MAKNSQKLAKKKVIFWPFFDQKSRFCPGILEAFPTSTTPSVYTHSNQHQILYKKGPDDIFRFPKVRAENWPSTENRPFFPKIPDFWPKIENFYDPPPMVEKISSRPCEPGGRSSDQMMVSIGQYWDDKNIERVKLAFKNILNPENGEKQPKIG